MEVGDTPSAQLRTLIHAGDGIFDLELNYGPFQDDADYISDPHYHWENDAPGQAAWNELGPPPSKEQNKSFVQAASWLSFSISVDVSKIR